MKKLIAIITLLALCLCLCSCSTPAPEEDTVSADLQSAKYVNIIKSGTFYMEATISGDDGSSQLKMAKDGDLMGMSATMPDGTQAGLVSKDGKNYIIDHTNKLVMITSAEVAASASKMPAETLDTEGLTHVKSDKGSFLGKTLPYDEYKSASGAVTRFYMDGTTLAGIEAVNGESTDIYEITTLSEKVPLALFELPADYPSFDLSSEE